MSSELQHIAFDVAGTAPPLSAAVRVGDLVFVSGMPGFDAKGQLPESFGEQFDLAAARLLDAVLRAGSAPGRLVKVNVLLTREADVADMNARYATTFGPAPYPARTTCVVRALPDPRMLVELEAVAAFIN